MRLCNKRHQRHRTCHVLVALRQGDALLPEPRPLRAAPPRALYSLVHLQDTRCTGARIDTAMVGCAASQNDGVVAKQVPAHPSRLTTGGYVDLKDLWRLDCWRASWRHGDVIE